MRFVVAAVVGHGRGGARRGERLFHARRLATPLQQSVAMTPGLFDKDRPLKLLGILCEYTQTNSV